jgi:hypothetical protein
MQNLEDVNRNEHQITAGTPIGLSRIDLGTLVVLIMATCIIIWAVSSGKFVF